MAGFGGGGGVSAAAPVGHLDKGMIRMGGVRLVEYLIGEERLVYIYKIKCYY